MHISTKYVSDIIQRKSRHFRKTKIMNYFLCLGETTHQFGEIFYLRGPYIGRASNAVQKEKQRSLTARQIQHRHQRTDRPPREAPALKTAPNTQNRTRTLKNAAEF